MSNPNSNFRQSGALTIKYESISKKEKVKKTKAISKTTGNPKTSKQPPPKERRSCGCQATIHDLFKNCTSCGYILCVLEDEGQCFYCGSYVTKVGTIPLDSQISKNSAENKDKYNIANIAQTDNNLQEAIQMRDRLLQYGKEKTIRTRIVDDQGDFYETQATNVWLSELEQKRALEKAKENEEKLNQPQSAKPIHISVDLNSQSFVEYEDSSKPYQFQTVDVNEMNNNDELLQSYYQNTALTGTASQIYATLHKLLEEERNTSNAVEGNDKKQSNENENENKNDEEKKHHLQDGSYMKRGNEEIKDFDTTNDEKKQNETENNKNVDISVEKKPSKKVRRRMQSKYYSDKEDEGVCLSMHQPWASLLVYGIKKVEGRSWSTQYRGRLWIAAAKRTPTPMEIDEIEKQYCEVYNLPHDKIPFPSNYPTSALLGCIDLVDCVSHEEYEKEYLQKQLSIEHNSSQYCFICENPRRLNIPGAIQGDHKLFKMPKQRIKPMQGCLVPVDLSWVP